METLILGALAAVVVGAGLFSIFGALARTAKRSDRRDDGGEGYFGDHHHDGGGDGGGD